MDHILISYNMLNIWVKSEHMGEVLNKDGITTCIYTYDMAACRLAYLPEYM